MGDIITHNSRMDRPRIFKLGGGDENMTILECAYKSG